LGNDLNFLAYFVAASLFASGNQGSGLLLSSGVSARHMRWLVGARSIVGPVADFRHQQFSPPACLVRGTVCSLQSS
jgi:hypothetical protein